MHLNRFILVLFLLLQAINLKAQYQSEWVKHTEGSQSGYVSITEAVPMPDGSIIAVGNYFSNVDFDPSSSQFILNTDFGGASPSVFWGRLFIWKLSENGDLIWAKAIGDSNQFARFVKAFPGESGNLIVLGRSQMDIDIDPGPAQFLINTPSGNSNSYFLASYNSNGQLEWGMNLNEKGEKSVSDFSISPAGDYLFRGHASGFPDFQPGPDSLFIELPPSRFHPFIWILSKQGGFKNAWYTENFPFVAAGHHGSFYAFGTSYQYSDISLNPNQQYLLIKENQDDNFLVKYNADGSVQWLSLFSRDSLSSVVAIKTRADGSCYVAGSRYLENPTLANPLMASHDMAFVKINHKGEKEWTRYFGGKRSETFMSLEDGYANDFFLTGHFVDTMDINPGPQTQMVPAKKFYDWLLLQLDANGEVKSYFHLGAIYDQDHFVVRKGQNGHIYTFGGFYNSINFHPGQGVNTISTTMGLSAFIQKLSIGTLNQSEYSAAAEVSVFPNPSGGLFSVQAKANLKMIKAYDYQGRCVFTKLFEKNDAPHFYLNAPAGNYLLEIYFENGELAVKQVHVY